MADEVRVYQSGGLFSAFFMTLFIVLFTPLFLTFMEALLTGIAANKQGYMSAEVIRLLQYISAAFLVGLVVLMWISAYLKLPRLELSSRSIKYLTFRYSLEAEWENIEQIKMFTETRRTGGALSRQYEANLGRGFVATKYNFQLTTWGRLLETFSYPNYQGIQIEPAFASNIYIGELAMDMKQHLPHLFEVNPYLV